jgi:hypothetical protein
MGGGLMQLVAYGAQDVYLTGNPQITFFKVVYRRHTNFSMECIEQPLDSARFGGMHTVQVLRNGDLAGKMYLMTTLPTLSCDGTATDNKRVAWVNRVGHALVDYIECTVGGSQVDKHYGMWYDLWYELTHTLDQEVGYKKMIGDVPELTSLAIKHNPYVLYVPLQFWFNRNTGLALPLIALQYHEVRFNLKLNSSADLIVKQASATPSTGELSESALLVDYIYLDSEERRRFAQVGHEYLIEQVQFGGKETLTGANNKVKLDFNHPCKELVWVAQSSAFSGEQTYLVAHDGSRSQQATVDEAARKLAWGMVRTAAAAGEDWRAINAGVPINANSIGIVSNTANGQTINVVVTNNDTVGANNIVNGAQVLAFLSTGVGNNNVNLLRKLRNITVNVRATEVNDGGVVTAWASIALTDVVVNQHELTMADVSVPLKSLWETDPRATGQKADVTLTQKLNYGLDLAGNGSLVKNAKLQLNGHDRFDERDGPYFNYVQPAQHHTRTPSDGVNVYSFGLHPEQHQPSGTANLSRIDTTLLWVTCADSLRATGVQLDRDGKKGLSGNQLSVFAFSYNVFRIMSGMGGLAYAN